MALQIPDFFLYVLDKVKPCVSHRDLNSRNVLVKSDLSCCLCDLGFALKISNSKYYHSGEEQETKSLNEVSQKPKRQFQKTSKAC